MAWWPSNNIILRSEKMIEEKNVKISTQKKFLFIPLVNVFIIWFCSCINIEYLKSKGADFGFLNVKFVFNLLIRAIWVLAIFTICMFLTNNLNPPPVISIVIAVIGMYVQMIVISWNWIKYQMILGIEQ